MSVQLNRVVALAVVGSTICVPLHGQSVLLRLNSEEGTVNRYIMGLETYMDIPMIQGNEPLMTGRVYQTQTVLSSEGDVFELQTTTDSADISMPLLQAMGQRIPNMSGQSQMMKMDTRGRMTDLTGPGGIEQFGIGNWFTLELPENPVIPGESWTANLNVDVPAGMGGSMALEMEITYTLVSVTREIASITFGGPIVMAGSAQGMAMDGAGGVSGTLMFDVEGGRLHHSETTVNMDMNAQGMAMAMEQSLTMQLLP